MHPAEVIIVIPCLNEAASIAPLISGCRSILANILVVDDGSTDDTAARAAKSGAKVVRHSRTTGKGSALMTGWAWAAKNGFKAALCMDGDGQHLPGDIPGFLNQPESAALVVGNRMANPAGMPPVRRWVNRWMSRRLSKLTRAEFPDSQCGFRLLRLDVLPALQLQASRFEIESELLVEVVRRGFAIRFVPIQVIYRGEASKINPLRDTWRWLSWYLRTRHRLRVDPHGAAPLVVPRGINL